MAGFDADAVRRAAGLTEVQQPAVLFAVGSPGGGPLPEGLREREQAPRTRRPLAELLLPGEPG